MKRHGMFPDLALLLMFLISQSVFAGWQVSTPQASSPRDPFFQAGTQRQTSFTPISSRHVRYPGEYANFGKTTPMYAVSVSGSLKENLERIMRRYNWKIVWKAPYDYNFDGRVTGSSLPNVLQKLLQPFPLQAVMYMSNRTIAVVPRQIR